MLEAIVGAGVDLPGVTEILLLDILAIALALLAIRALMMARPERRVASPLRLHRRRFTPLPRRIGEQNGDVTEPD